MRKPRKRSPRLDIEVPHLAFTVRVREINGTEPDSRCHLGEPAVAFTRFDDGHNVSIYLGRPCTASTVVHEVTHAVQWIFRKRNMLLDEEIEHAAYLVQYLFDHINNRWAVTQYSRVVAALVKIVREKSKGKKVAR